MGRIIAIACGYLLGSTPTAWMAGKLLGIDIRKAGSGNTGATNAFRVLGPLAAAAVLLVDAGKGVAAVLALPALGAALFSAPDGEAPGLVELRVLCGAAAVIGHVYSVWLGFRGGKGVATGAAVAFVLTPLAACVSLLAFLVVAFATRYVSLASLVAAVVLPVAYLALYHEAGFSVSVVGFCCVATLLVVFSHRANIRRLLRGEEPRFGSRARDETISGGS